MQADTLTADQTEAAIAAHRDGIHLPIRWIVPSFENAPGAGDSQTAASYGEMRQLVQEVTDICERFDLAAPRHTFPSGTPVFLFWQARSTSDWIVARISAKAGIGSAQGPLEYLCLVFDDSTFHALRYNPFRTRSLNLHDRLRSHLQENRTDPFRCTVPRRSVPAYRPFAALAADNAGSRAKTIPGITEDRLPTEANQRTIQEFCSVWTDDPTPPPAFATWWGGDARVEDIPDCLDVVLRRKPVIAMTLEGARNAIGMFSAALNDTLSTVSTKGDLVAADLVYVIQSNSRLVAYAMEKVVAASQSGQELQLRNDISEAALQLGQIGTGLESLANRINETSSAAKTGSLTILAKRARELESAALEMVYTRKVRAGASRASLWPALRRIGGQKPQKSVAPIEDSKRKHQPWQTVLGMLVH